MEKRGKNRRPISEHRKPSNRASTHQLAADHCGQFHFHSIEDSQRG